MRGLYYSIHPFENTYIKYLYDRYRNTSRLAADENELKTQLEQVEYDVVLLELKENTVRELAAIGRIAAYVREKCPASVIVIHRNHAPVEGASLCLPSGAYDFSLANRFGADNLEDTIQTMILRRLSFVSNNKEPCNLRGILYMRHPGMAQLCGDCLSAAGFSILQLHELGNIAPQLSAFHPDFLFLHCDTTPEGTNVAAVKHLAALVKQTLPECLVLISSDIPLEDRYKGIPGMDPKHYNHHMDPAPPPLELLLLLLKEEAKKYKLDIVTSSRM
jgi:hypothetical protein